MCPKNCHKRSWSYLERVQLILSEVGSLGSLPQFNHSGLPKLYRGRTDRQKDEELNCPGRQFGASLILAQSWGRELWRGAVTADGYYDTITISSSIIWYTNNIKETKTACIQISAWGAVTDFPSLQTNKTLGITKAGGENREREIKTVLCERRREVKGGREQVIEWKTAWGEWEERK